MSVTSSVTSGCHWAVLPRWRSKWRLPPVPASRWQLRKTTSPMAPVTRWSWALKTTPAPLFGEKALVTLMPGFLSTRDIPRNELSLKKETAAFYHQQISCYPRKNSLRTNAAFIAGVLPHFAQSHFAQSQFAQSHFAQCHLLTLTTPLTLTLTPTPTPNPSPLGELGLGEMGLGEMGGHPIWCKKLAQEKTCARKHDTRSKKTCKVSGQVSGTRFLSMSQVTHVNTEPCYLS